MSQENVEVVRGILAQWSTGDFGFSQEVVSALDSNLVFVVEASFPESGVFLGLNGLREFTRRFFAQWDRYAIEETRLQAVGDTVLAHIVQRSTGKSSGIESELASFMLFTFQGRRIVRIDNILEEKEALEAAGLKE
jgi:ketosteroid isomerase-like protein